MNPQVKQEGSNPNPRITSPAASVSLIPLCPPQTLPLVKITQRTVCKPRFKCNA